MDHKTAGTLEILAALLVLFAALMDPRVSAAIAIIALLALGAYTFVQKAQ